MALYTDAEFISLADLQSADGEIDSVRASEKLTLATVIAQGSQEAGHRLLSRIQSSGSNFGSSGDLSWNHIGAVMGYSTGGNLPRVQLGQIVVTNPRPGYMSAVKLFAVYSTLALFYRQASERISKQVDRYQLKLNEFRAALFREYWPMLQAQGLPVVFSAMPCPGAIHEPNTGTWVVSGTSSGSAASAGTYDIAITWVGANYVSQVNKSNAESGPSAIKQVTLTIGQFALVDITGLNPPTSHPINPVPAGYTGYNSVIPATGWNIYAAPAAGTLKLVNAVPIPIATKTATADLGTLLGYVLGTGQYPDIQMPIVSTIMRA